MRPARHITGTINLTRTPSRPYRQGGGPAVVRAYSLQGFDLRFGGGILEMRTEGERTVAAGWDPGRAFEHVLASESVLDV